MDIGPDTTYMRATVNVDVNYYQVTPNDLWRDTAHEIAHLVTAEANMLWERLPEEVKKGPLQPFHTESIERPTVLLERMFLRDCPEPDWSADAV